MQAFYSRRAVRLKVKSERRGADIEKRWDQSIVRRADPARGDRVNLVWVTRREVQMKVLYGKYPRLGMVALIASIALASGAAKKWC
jgi:hypothetical protein